MPINICLQPLALDSCLSRPGCVRAENRGCVSIGLVSSKWGFKRSALFRYLLVALMATGWMGGASASAFLYTSDRVIVIGAGTGGLSGIPTEIYSTTTGATLGVASGKLTTWFEDVGSNGYDFVISNVIDPESGQEITAGIDFGSYQYFGVDGDGLDVWALYNVSGDPLSAMVFRVNLSSGTVFVDSAADAVRFDRIASPIPEPGTLWLTLLGVFGMVCRRLRCAA